MIVHHVSLEHLRSHPNSVFVFGDNLLRRGCRGAALFRHEPNAYGFVTKRYPSNDVGAFYHPAGYAHVFHEEFDKLVKEIEAHPERTYLITPLGSGLANRFKIWERVIRPWLRTLTKYPNVRLLWED